MTIIGLAANDQSLSIVSKPKVASGDQNSVKVQIDFDAVWDDYGKSAVFFTDKKPKDVYEIILVNGECVIPFEVLEKSGVLYIGVRGVNASEDKVKTSTLVKYKIVDGAPEGEGASVPPTSNVYRQLLTAYGKQEDLLAIEKAERKTADNDEANERKAEIAVERARIDQMLADGEVVEDGLFYVVSKSITAATSEKTLTIQLPESFRINPLVFVNVRPENNIDWYFGTSGTQSGGSGGSSSGSGASPDDETPTELKFTYVSKVGASVPGWVQFIIAKTESAFLGGKDAELADLRVDMDGKTHDSAGSAVRDQFVALADIIKNSKLYSRPEMQAIEVEGYFVRDNGLIAENESYSISEAIHVPGGYRIVFGAEGYKTQVAMISKKNSDETFTPLVTSVDSDFHVYEYTTTEDTDIVLSWSHDREHSLIIFADLHSFSDALKAYANKRILETTETNELDNVSLSLFSNFGVVGDSYASGELYFDGDFHDVYNISWGQVLARKTGTKCVNFSAGGLSTRGWLNNSKGLSLLLETEPQDIYYLALGINDANNYGAEYLGSLRDLQENYAQNPDTFYGNYGKIIGNIKNHAPNAKIVMFSIVPTTEMKAAYNDAIFEIADHFGVPYIVQTDDSFFTSDFYGNGKVEGHPTAPVYSGMANAFERLLKKCIIENYEYFSDAYMH